MQYLVSFQLMFSLLTQFKVDRLLKLKPRYEHTFMAYYSCDGEAWIIQEIIFDAPPTANAVPTLALPGELIMESALWTTPYKEAWEYCSDR
jgi:hypothetical protein